MDHLIKPFEAYTMDNADYLSLDAPEVEELLRRFHVIGLRELMPVKGKWLLLPRESEE